MKPVLDVTKNLEIAFHEVQYGWIEFTLTLGGKSFDTRFSEVYDPILDLKNWLEAVCTGVEQCSFSFDTEGQDIKFNLERISWDKDIFTVTEPYDNAEIYLCDYIDRKQLVKEFYLGLLNFRNSPEFSPENWEIEYMWERLSKILDMPRELLVDEFSKLDRAELKTLLFKADPQYSISYSGVSDKENIRLFIEETIKNKPLPAGSKRVETPLEWQVPEDYNEWTMERKREFAESCLNEATSGYGGTKIRDFKSPIIDDFLTEM